jgi:hypothetical protein
MRHQITLSEIKSYLETFETILASDSKAKKKLIYRPYFDNKFTVLVSGISICDTSHLHDAIKHYNEN